MADKPWDATKERGAGDGPGSAAVNALLTLTTVGVAISGVIPYLTLGVAAANITYVLKWCDIISGYSVHNDIVFFR